jgi:hypothetical protein
MTAASPRLPPRCRKEGCDLVARQGRPGFHDRDNFVTNRVTVADYDDARACSSVECAEPFDGLGVRQSERRHYRHAADSISRKVKGGVDEEEWDHPLYRILEESPNADQTPVDFFEFTALRSSFTATPIRRSSIGFDGRVIALQPPLLPNQVRA